MMRKINRRSFASLAFASLALPSVVRAQSSNKVRIAIQFGLAYLPVMLAEKEGLFSKHATSLGLSSTSFEVSKVGSSTAINDAILSGSAELGAYGSTALLVAWDKTRGAQRVNGLCGLSLTPYSLLANKESLKSLSDFGPNDRIAVTSTISPQATLLRMAAEKELGAGKHAALDESMQSMSHPDATNALLNGLISAYFSTPPYTAAALKNPKIHRITTSAQILGSKCTGAMLGASAGFAEKNPAIVQAVVNALGEAMKMISNDLRQAAQVYLALEPQNMGVDEVVEILQDPERGYDLAPQGFVAFAKFMHRTGQLRNDLGRWQDAFLPPVHSLSGS